jgi:ureidoglycolate hydrolase
LAIDPQLIEVSSCLVDDYYPLVDSEKWCVAAICASEHNCADGIGQMERHNETDEVFVLMRGESVLFVATGQCECGIGRISNVKMDSLRVYNVKRGVWHACALGSDAVVLVVENSGTGRSNSDYAQLTTGQRRLVMDACAGLTGPTKV